MLRTLGLISLFHLCLLSLIEGEGVRLSKASPSHTFLLWACYATIKQNKKMRIVWLVSFGYVYMYMFIFICINILGNACVSISYVSKSV